MEKYIIILSGPSCVGKSTIAKNIIRMYDRIFHIKTDFLKRLISRYSPERDRELKDKLTIGLCEQAMKESLSIIIEPHNLDGYRDLSVQYNYNYLFVYLEASYSTLLKRFKERVKDHNNSGAKIYMNADIGKFQDIYERNKNITPEDKHIICNTDSLQPKEIIKLILKTIEENK